MDNLVNLVNNNRLKWVIGAKISAWIWTNEWRWGPTAAVRPIDWLGSEWLNPYVQNPFGNGQQNEGEKGSEQEKKHLTKKLRNDLQNKVYYFSFA
jgi:hypothetical protein